MMIYETLDEYIKAGRPWNDGVLISGIPEYRRCTDRCYVYQGKIYGERGRLLKLGEYSDHNKKYLSVHVGGVNIKAHRAIAWVYCDGQSQERNEVDHINGDKRDNSPTNLRWVSHEENMRAYRMLRRHVPGQMSFWKM